jgi:cytochrome c5
MAATCPAGHESTTDDYCDTCGAPIGAATAPAEAPAPAAAEAEPEAEPAPAAATCPGCGEPVVGRFCESCGYDVESGTPAAPPPVNLVLGTDRAHWERMVGSGEPAFPSVGPTLNFELSGDRAVLGRVRSGAAVDVDLALTGTAADPAISHKQCVFERDGGRWTVRDADSSNGTWINDATEPLAAGATHTLVHGDRILVGAWTSLTVQIDRPSPSPTTPSAPSAEAAPSPPSAEPAPSSPSAEPDPS